MINIANGIALDRDGNLWVVAVERQAIVVVTKNRKVIEVFRNPVNSDGLRNSADPAVGNNHILEGPTAPSYRKALLHGPERLYGAG